MNNYILKRYEHKSGIYTNLGSTVLKSIQNETTEKMELLVRESIQNSLDAGLSKQDVKVEFTINEIVMSEVFKVVQDLNKEYFYKNYKGDIQKQIVISDKNTQGLTGDIRTDLDTNSNLFKLIYNVGQAQQNKGSGGSWGYGKTIYYRIGNGLVLFYSRIKENNGYSERLVISLIEDETKESKVIVPSNLGKYAGINFWGETIIPENDNQETPTPITDPDKIERILNVFKIKRYEGKETGTLIAIPFIKENELLESINANRNFRYDDLNDFLTTSIQRWYAPRLNNNNYIYGNKNNLIVSINGEELKPTEQEIFFEMIRGMYVYGTTNNDDELKLIFPKVDFYNDKITVRSQQNKGMVGELVGNFVYTKIHYRDIGMSNSSELKNPYSLTNNEQIVNGENSNNKPILLMTRQPGMVIQYDVQGSWVNRVVESSVDEFIIGFFILNSSPSIYFETDNNTLTLEEYIRSSEKADHMNWGDSTYKHKGETIEPRIVQKVKTTIQSRINRKFKVSDFVQKKSSTEHLQSIFGEYIMPPLNYGKASTRAPKSSNSVVNKGRSKEANITILYDHASYGFELINIPFEMQIIDGNFDHIIMQVSIQTDSGVLNISRFEEETEKVSPISIKDIKITSDSGEHEKNIKILNKSVIKIVNNAMRPFKRNDEIKGIIILNNYDKNVIPIIRTEINGGENNEKI